MWCPNDYFSDQNIMQNPIEAYAEELVNAKNLPLINISKLSWNYCIKNKIYVQPTQKDSFGATFNSTYATHVICKLFTNDNLTEEQVLNLINKWPSADYTDYIITLVKLLITNPNIKDYTKFKPVYYKVSNKHGCIIELVHIFQSEKLDFDINLILNICKYILNLETEFMYDILLFATIKYGFTQKHIDIPENALIMSDTVAYLFGNVSIKTIKEHYLNIITREREYMYAYIKYAHEVPPEFEGKIDNVLINILMNNEGEITADAFEQCRDKRGAITAYIDTFHKAPPEYMCMKDYREQILYALSKIENCIIPDYLFDYATIACEHYDKDAYCINMDTNEIKCEYCYANFEHKDKLAHIYNIKCLICFDEHPEKLHVFDCGHTLCLECYKRHDKCPLCDRHTSDDSEETFTIASDDN